MCACACFIFVVVLVLLLIQSFLEGGLPLFSRKWLLQRVYEANEYCRTIPIPIQSNAVQHCCVWRCYSPFLMHRVRQPFFLNTPYALPLFVRSFVKCGARCDTIRYVILVRCIFRYDIRYVLPGMKQCDTIYLA